MTDIVDITVTTYQQAREAFRRKELRQALYDEGEVVMADVLVNLHGADHRARRRLENRLFRKDTHRRYEREAFPPVVAATLAPHVARGHAELVTLSHELMMNLAAYTAGVDRPKGTRDETLHLYSYLMLFIQGATLAHYTGDRESKRAEVAAGLAAFDDEFLAPSIARRRALIAEAHETGDETGLPQDVLTTLLLHEDELCLPSDVVLREICFFLLAGAHTSATAFVRTLHHVFAMADDRPEDVQRARTDLAFLQRCVHETVRLQPSSPIAMRWALADVDLPDGVHVPAGARLTIDLMAVNRDPEAFGDRAGAFDPHRTLQPGVAPWGLSFGLGMHACIGQDLAAGLDPMGSAVDDEHLYGLVPVAVRALLDAGGCPDPANPPTMDPGSSRGYWGRYPVVFPA